MSGYVICRSEKSAIRSIDPDRTIADRSRVTGTV